jgi:hypothetical protein
LSAEGEYDLDNVVTLTLPKTAMTQKQLKALFGEEVRAYADAHQMVSPIEEMNRCWRLHYSDEVAFHLDTLPCVAEEEDVIAAIMGFGVPRELAKRAVAITDKRHPYYTLVSSNWLSSNPRGFARWFEERTRSYALPRLRRLVESRLYSKVEDVPAFEWKTPLQRSIQLLKRHRDVMFQKNPELAPISMILTNLATHSYNGASDIFAAVTEIIDRMPSFIRAGRTRVPNPADPAEDYADKWTKEPQLEQNFWSWHMQVKADLAGLPDLLRGDRLTESVRRMFRLDLTQEQMQQFQPVRTSVRNVSYAAPPIAITSAPRPWGNQ